MSAPISQMVPDLEKFIAQHALESTAQVRAVADQMANAADAMSSPLYGLSVTATVRPVLAGSVVDVATRSVPGAIGTVYGGERALMTSLDRKMASIAQEAGLDSTG